MSWFLLAIQIAGFLCLVAAVVWRVYQLSPKVPVIGQDATNSHVDEYKLLECWRTLEVATRDCEGSRGPLDDLRWCIAELMMAIDAPDSGQKPSKTGAKR